MAQDLFETRMVFCADAEDRITRLAVTLYRDSIEATRRP